MMNRFRLMLAALVSSLAFAAPAIAQQWCGNGNLNLTERTICLDPILGGLDNQMTQLYGAVVNTAVRERQRAWLNYRNSCAGDTYCIENAYLARIAELRGTPTPPPPPTQPQVLRRPWCANGNLNPTEATICGNDNLANVDAAMAAVYGAAQAYANDGSQLDWLRNGRDACGTNVDCIGNAYLRRIIDLGGRLRAAGN